jgi:prophage antirepressor-like protein
MNNEISTFTSEEFGNISVLIIDEKPYFPATECAEILGYSKGRNAISMHCRYALKQGVPHPQNQKKLIEKIFIPEGDLYRLIIKSKLPTAERFEKWVMDEVLPTIRKHSAYLSTETLQRVANNMDETKKLIEDLFQSQKDLKHLKAKNILLEHDLSYYNGILHNKSSVPVSIIAKDYGMSAIQFNKILKSLKIQFNMNGTWLLYAEYQDRGYTHSYTFMASEKTVIMQTNWTQKGRLFLYECLKEIGIVPVIERSA